MPNPKLCAAGVTLRDQVNRAFPDRDRRSDGWIGNADHKSRGSKSDHNPTSEGWVRAIDIDADLSDDRKASFILANQLRLLARSDRRLAYVIYAGKIASPRSLWRWRKYTGINPHNHHIHCSFRKKGDTDGRPFDLAILKG